MAKTAKKVETPVKKKTVKASGVRVRSKEDAKGFFSKKDTPPINDVWDPVKGIMIEGLTEKQKVMEGLIPRRKRRYSFQKSEEERAEWALVHTNAKGPTGGYAKVRNEAKHTLIAHFINTEKLATFITTRSFKEVGRSEIQSVLRASGKVAFDSNPLEVVSKYYFAGKRYLIKDGQAIEG